MPASPQGKGGLSPRRSPKKVLGMPVSPRVKRRRLPPQCAPQNLARLANTEAGPSHLIVSGSPHVVATKHDLLVLPPIPREVFEELTTMFSGPDSTLVEPGTSNEEAKARNIGWDVVPDLE
jgi:hypothetical protein